MFNPITHVNRKSLREESLRNTTIREFGGGWNVLDNDLNLSSRFAKVFRNFVRGEDGTVKLRYGTRLFTTFPSLGEIINCEYYANAVIAVDKNGLIAASDGTGTTVLIWSPEIAATLSGNPPGWSATDFVSFAKFRGDLIVCNGVDKPLIINQSLFVTYLADLGGIGGPININTPIGRYVAAANRYTVIAGDPSFPSILHVSNIDTSGTWFGDVAPNDAVQVDLGPYISIGSNTIKGISNFRDRLLVAFEEVILVVQLGVYDTVPNPDVHTPIVEDVIPQHGSISHRAMQSLGDDMLFCDIVGVPSLKRSLFTETLRPDRVSQLVDPEIQKRLSRLSTASLEDRVFSVYNRADGQYMLFIPDEASGQDVTETIGFIYTLIPALKIEAWSEFRGWNWRSACRSAQGRIFFSKDNELYVYGSRQDVIYGDFIGEQETYSDETVHTDGTGFVTDDEQINSGVPTEFDWQLPWADFDRRTSVKHVRYISLDTRGTAAFDFGVFVDNVYESISLGEPYSDETLHTDNYGFANEDATLDPELSIPFVGGEARGFGVQPFGNQHFGAGRVSADERLYAATARGKIFKMRVSGASRDPLQVVSIGIDYLIGSIRR